MIRTVVVNFNSAEILTSLRALLASDLDQPHDVVVVDNGSTDGSPERIAAELPQVRLVRSPRNLGYPGLNQVLRDLSGVDAVAIVNPDAVVAPDCLKRLFAELEADPGLGAACPLILLEGDYREARFSVDGTDRASVELVAIEGAGRWHLTGPRVRRRWDGGVAWTVGDGSVLRATGDHVRLTVRSAEPVSVTVGSGSPERIGRSPALIAVALDGPALPVIQNAGSIIGRHGLGENRGYHQPLSERWTAAIEVPAWCGAAVLLRADYLRDVGLLDERWFLYYEDTDLAWRGLLKGWRYRVVPAARVRHAHSTTIGHGSALYEVQHERNRLLTVTKNAPLREVVAAWADALRLMARQLRADFLARVRDRRRPELVPTARRLKALWGAARLTPAVVRDRRVVRGAATVQDIDLPVLGRWHEPTGTE